MNRVVKDDVVFVAVDFQEKLMPAMSKTDEVKARAAKLCKGMKVLGVPALVTQQYTKGLGETVPVIAEALGEYELFEKITFSACGCQEFIDRIEELKKKTVVVAGVETHICVQQTALDLLALGYNVYVIADCISSRNESDKHYAIERMRQCGAVITTYEAVLYQLLGSAKAAEFKEISNIVK